MKRMQYCSISIIVASFLFLCCIVFMKLTVSGQTYDYEEQYQKALAYEKEQVNREGLDDWSVFTLARVEALSEQQKQEYLADLKELLEKKKGVLSRNRSTEYSRRILAVTALGVDADNVYGYSLIEPLSCYDFAVQQGIYGCLYTLLALDCGNYEIAISLEGYQQTTRERLISYLLQRQLSDGGWAVSGRYADPDTTAIVISALTPYYKTNSEVARALDRGLVKLASMMGDNGAYASYGIVNAESTAQVLASLAVFGIPVEQEAFTKEEYTILDGLFSFQLTDGSFMHAMGGGSSRMATQQALYAMNALKRRQAGKPSLYDMTDVRTDTSVSGEKKSIDLAGLWGEFKQEEAKEPAGESKPEEKEEGKPKPGDNNSLEQEEGTVRDNHEGKDSSSMYPLPDSNSVINCQSELASEMSKTPAGWETPRLERNATKDLVGNQKNKKSRTRNHTVTVKFTVKPHASRKFISAKGQPVYQTQGKKADKGKVKNQSLLVFPSKKHEEIALLMENGVSFTVRKKGFSSPLMLREKVTLEDGDYVLCRYIDETAKPEALAKVWVKDKVLQAVIKEPGQYFVGKRVRNESVSAIRTEQSERMGEQSEEIVAEEQKGGSDRQADMMGQQNFMEQQDDKKLAKGKRWLSRYWWLSLLLMSVIMIGCGWICRRGRK